MTKVKVSELIGPALRWAVAGAELELERHEEYSRYIDHKGRVMWERRDLSWLFEPDTDWAQGGPIIERERIAIQFGPQWTAVHHKHLGRFHYGPTALIAAMRCYVASKLGDEVDVPKELL